MRAILALSLLVACKGPAEPEDTDVADTDDTDAVPTFCEQQGWTERAWVDAPDDNSLYATAADIELDLPDGSEVKLSELWTGCESFLFVQDDPRQADGWPDALWSRDVEELFERTPKNVHYVFLSATEVPALRDQIDDVLADMDDEDREWWASHVHYVEEDPTDQQLWLGDLMRRPGWGVGIDRFQRLRFVGSYADPDRYSSSMGWFAPNLSMVANEAVYYNFESDREDRLAAEDATVIEAFTGEVVSDPGWAGVRGYAEIDFPDAATMAGFDTMAFDLTLGCEGDGEYGDCPAWDYLVHLYLCEKDDPDTCNVEFGRWITTYHREGRWVHDVSALLPLVADGGTRRVAFYTQQPYETHLSVRLSNQGKEARPSEATFLYSGGSFDAAYNDKYEPVELTIPSDAKKVEIATVISGHGQVDPGNCAEFCNTEHHFYVNGAGNVRELADAGVADRCMEQVAEGTVPNQYGTWWYGRSGWCPGKEVPVVLLDVTDQVTKGAANTFDYEAFRGGNPYTNGGANIVLSSWVVVSK